MCFSWYIYYTWSPYTVINVSIYSPATLHKMDLSARYDSAMSAISPKVNVIVWFSKHLCKKHSFDIIKVYNLSILEERRITFDILSYNCSWQCRKETRKQESKDWTMCYSQKSIYTDTYTILYIWIFTSYQLSVTIRTY